MARARKFSGRTLPGPGPAQALPWLLLLQPSGPFQSFLKGEEQLQDRVLLGGPLQKGQGKEVGSEARQPPGPFMSLTGLLPSVPARSNPFSKPLTRFLKYT